MVLEIKTLNKESYGEYEHFLLSQETSLFYHSTKYKNFLEDLLKCESKYLLAYENGKIVAALPLMIKDGPYGKVVNSLPYYGSNGGVIGEVKSSQELLLEYNNLVSSSEVVSATYIQNPLSEDASQPIHNSTDIRIGQLSAISCEGDYKSNIFKLIVGNRRNEIRKAEKSGVIVYEDVSAMDFVQTIHQEEMSLLNRKYKTDDFFNRIKKYFTPNKDYKIFVAERNNKKIAALLIFYFNSTVEYFTPVVISDQRSYQPMSLIIYHAIEDAMKRGFKWFNWGGTWASQKGVYRFKKQFGAKNFTYNYYIQVNNKSLLGKPKKKILEMYPNFYVFNFGAENS